MRPRYTTGVATAGSSNVLHGSSVGIVEALPVQLGAQFVLIGLALLIDPAFIKQFHAAPLFLRGLPPPQEQRWN